MIKISFQQFWKKVNLDLKMKPIVHRLERAEEIIFIFKHSSGWDYYTSIVLEDIFRNAQETGIDPNNALEYFYEEYGKKSELILECTELPEPEYEIEDEEDLYISSKSIDAGEDVVEEAKDYADFYTKTVDSWKQKVTAKLESEQFYKAYTTKTFGDFLRVTLNTINARPFLKVIRRFIKGSLDEGLQSAEQEMNRNIELKTSLFSDKLMALEGQQLNGYTINGKMWYGIKGATQEMQVRIYRQVAEDVQNKVPKSQMIKNVQSIFDGVGQAQAERIARTETNRFINEGKLIGYKESGISGRKAWSVVPKKCCEICDRMHKLYFEKGIEYDEKFKDPMTGKEFLYPPAHPHCRCTLEYRQL